MPTPLSFKTDKRRLKDSITQLCRKLTEELKEEIVGNSISNNKAILQDLVLTR
jgi:hypothetical protein